MRGRVLPIGGLKEKVLAAHRGGITTVIVPKENQKDIRDIPKAVLKTVKLLLVEHMDQVLGHALKAEDPSRFLVMDSDGDDEMGDMTDRSMDDEVVPQPS